MIMIEGDLVLKENTTYNDDLIVLGDIKCKGGFFDLTCHNLTCRNLDCWNLTCCNLDCNNLTCHNLTCCDLTFYAFAIAYTSFKCKSWKARRDNYVIKCLDKDIEIIPDKPKCLTCGKELE